MYISQYLLYIWFRVLYGFRISCFGFNTIFINILKVTHIIITSITVHQHDQKS